MYDEPVLLDKYFKNQEGSIDKYNNNQLLIDVRKVP